MCYVRPAKPPAYTKYAHTVKPVLSGHSQKDQKWVFKTNYRLVQVKSIAECSPWTCIEQPHGFKIFCLFLSGRSRQVLLDQNLNL